MKRNLLSLSVAVTAVLLLAGLLSASAGRADAGAFGSPSRPQIRAPERLALVRIAWQSDDDLARVEAAGVAVYARLTGDEGSYLLAGALPGAIEALREAGVDLAVLDRDLSGASYYLAYAPRDWDRHEWVDYGRLLLDDGRQVLLRASSQKAEQLASDGVKLRALTLDAKPLWPVAGKGTIPLSVTVSPRIQAMIDQVDADTLYQYTGDLSGEWPVTIGGEAYTITTRHTDSGEPLQKATQFVYEHLESLELEVSYHDWSRFGHSGRNVVGELRGETHPDDVLILCAHLDSITYQHPLELAPGADDNASGTATVLLAADILSQYRWGCTLRFALWTGEEEGLLGSYSYAQRASNNNEKIDGVLNLDMVGWDEVGGPDIDLHADETGVPASMDLAELFSDVVGIYDLNLVPEIIPNGTGASDHASFWDYGYAAILGIEDYYPGRPDFNPYYHTEEDLLEHLDMEYLAEFARASIGTFAHMGCLLPEDASLYVYLPLVVRAK